MTIFIPTAVFCVCILSISIESILSLWESGSVRPTPKKILILRGLIVPF